MAWTGHRGKGAHVQWEEPLQLYMNAYAEGLPWVELAQVGASEWNSNALAFADWLLTSIRERID
eukprot:10648387-Alexandrium_andersonii.AAC.1